MDRSTAALWGLGTFGLIWFGNLRDPGPLIALLILFFASREWDRANRRAKRERLAAREEPQP